MARTRKMDGNPITHADTNQYVTVKLNDDQAAALITTLERTQSEMEKMLYVIANDINEAEQQITHRSNNPPVVRDAWIKVRDEAVEKMRELQAKFDSTQSIIEALQDRKNSNV
jgi:hypothetical protein